VHRNRYDKPPLAARCCHLASDLTNFTETQTDRQTNGQTNRQIEGHHYRIELPHMRAGINFLIATLKPHSNGP